MNKYTSQPIDEQRATPTPRRVRRWSTTPPRTAYTRYEARKRALPPMTPDQYEAACRRIAREEGI